MEKATVEYMNSNDLEQQLLNVLDFITEAPKSNTSLPHTYSSDSLQKGLYYLKEESYPLAAKWLRMSAMSGDQKGQFYLGLLFLKGQGVPQSPFHAMAWLQLAKSQGFMAAEEMISQLTPHLTTKRIKDAQCYAATLYEQIHSLINITPNH